MKNLTESSSEADDFTRLTIIQQEKHMKIYLAPLEGITGYTY